MLPSLLLSFSTSAHCLVYSKISTHTHEGNQSLLLKTNPGTGSSFGLQITLMSAMYSKRYVNIWCMQIRGEDGGGVDRRSGCAVVGFWVNTLLDHKIKLIAVSATIL